MNINELVQLRKISKEHNSPSLSYAFTILKENITRMKLI